MTQPLKVIYEDNHLLVIDKPALLATMGAEKGQPTLLSDAKDYIAKKYNKPGKVYLGVVSRLDAFVTGVIVFARTSKSAERLNRQFKNRTAQKTYWAIIPDRLSSLEGSFEDWVAKDDEARRMRVVAGNANDDAKLARLSYKTIGHNVTNDTALVSIRLETGRKHQIRVQFSSAGTPILGDRKYGSDLPFERGIALHSRKLAIEHPTLKEDLVFESPPPNAWDLSRFNILEA